MRDWLTTGEAARVIGVTAEHIRGEIRDLRLEAEVIPRERLPGRRWARSIIRIYPQDFARYLTKYWPRVVWRDPAA